MSRSIMEQRPPDHLLAQDRRDLERWQWEGGTVPEAHPVSKHQGRHSYLYERGLPHTTAGLLEDTHRRGVQTLPSPSARPPSA